MIQTNHWRADKIQQNLEPCGPPATPAETSGIPKKEWPMRHERVLIPQNKKRGRPPLSRSVNLDHLKEEPSTSEIVRKSTPRSSKKLKTEAVMIPITNMIIDTATPQKKKRGRPPLSKTLSVKPKIEVSGSAINGADGGKTFVKKKGRGRPLGSLSKKVQNTPSTSFQGLLGPKRGRGRPKKTDLLLLKKTLKMPNISAVTKQITVRLTKMNEDKIKIAGQKMPLKVENNKIVGENKKKPMNLKMREKKKFVLANKKSLEKNKIKTKNAVVELTDIMREKKVTKMAEVASVTVVLEKQRGRPKKHQPSAERNEQVTRRCFKALPRHFKSEDCQVDNQFPGDFNSQRVENPTVSTELLQISQETAAPIAVQQGSWEAEEAMREDAQTQRYPTWEANPTHTVWTLDDGVESVDSSSVTQFVVGEPMAPQASQSQCCKGPVSEHFNFQEDLLQGLSDFRCQMTRELAATRREVREAAELVRSAIAGVSTEIHRVGLILQPLVNVITTGNLFCRSPNYADMTPMFHPPQETPPDNTVDLPQSSAPQKNSFPIRHEGASLDHLTTRDTPTVCSTESFPEIIPSVKTEDLTDNPQSCTYHTQAILSMEADKSNPQPLFISHHDIPQASPMRSLHKVTASATSDFCADIPPSITHHVKSHNSQLEQSGPTPCAPLSDETAPTDDSLSLFPKAPSSANHDDLMDNSSQRDSPPTISGVHSIGNESTVCSVDSFHKDPSPAVSTDNKAQDLFLNNFEEHAEKDTNPVLHPCVSPAPSPGNLQEDVDQVVDLPSLQSNKFLCQTQEPSMINLRTSPVTVPNSFMGSSTEMLQSEPGNLEGIFLEETLSKSTQDFSERFLNSVVPSQTLPTSPRAHTPLL